MLLETLDLRTNDILIYSKNLFNFGENFKIIHKNAKVKIPQSISYFDVCSFVKDPSPKNLIIYRLLTNVRSLDAYSTKYGYFIKINGRMELVYFDPVFAIKDLRHLRFDLDPGNFRFKIQQVGLTSLTKWESEPNFAEVYSFDLKAVEAQNQNDKIFADAVFAFDPDFVDEDEIENEKYNQPADKIHKNILKENEPGGLSSMQIAEDKTVQKENLSLPDTPDALKASDLREEIISILKQALNIPEDRDIPIEKKLHTNQSNQHNDNLNDEGNLSNAVNLLDLFKSTHKSDGLTIKEKESIVLKFEKK